MEKIKVSVKLNCTAKEVFSGWLDDKIHSEFTGGTKAKTSPSEGGKFSVWDGYITGTNVEIFPHKRIIQKWRTTDFVETDEDSVIELFFTFFIILNQSFNLAILLTHVILSEHSRFFLKSFVF